MIPVLRRRRCGKALALRCAAAGYGPPLESDAAPLALTMLEPLHALGQMTGWRPTTDLYEEDNQIVVKAELPGVKKVEAARIARQTRHGVLTCARCGSSSLTRSWAVALPYATAGRPRRRRRTTLRGHAPDS